MTKIDKSVRVRFAPSPTGMLHIGGARTAIDNWAYAKATGGKFILRIEDTDLQRSTEENTQIILRALSWLGLDWDEGPITGGDYGPYFQTKRLDSYKKALQYLWENDACYPCFCSKEELEKKKELAIKEQGGYNGYDKTCRKISRKEAIKRMESGEAYVWRLKVPENHKPIEFDDEVYGHMTFPAEVMDDLVLTRGKDNIPTYNFAVVCDDSAMGITHVVRGDDHLSNTPRQILIYEALNKPIPKFAHLSMILGNDGKKLSKRHGSTSVEEYKERGYLPEAVVNFLALLGWSLDDKTTIIPKKILTKEFDLNRITRKDAIFDETKLDWMNGCYIRDMGSEKLAKISKEWFAKAKVLGESESEAGTRTIPSLTKDEIKKQSLVIKKYDKNMLHDAIKWVDDNFETYKKVCPLIIERLVRLDEIPQKLSFMFWGKNIVFDEKSLTKALQKEGQKAKLVLEKCLQIFNDEKNEWTCDNLQSKCQEKCLEMDMKPRLFFQAIRVAICGNLVSPPLFELIELMDKKDILARIKTAIRIAVN